MTHEWTKGPTKWTHGNTLFVSIPFTWNLPDVMREARHPDMFHKRVVIGGPAVRLAKAGCSRLVCAQCGAEETPPYDDGDACEEGVRFFQEP